jgi:hypothetical protein
MNQGMAIQWRSGRHPKVMRPVLAFLVCVLAASALEAADAAYPGEIRLTQEALYPAVRRSASPSGGLEVHSNPPALLWPVTAGKGVRYHVRLSQDAAFPTDRPLGATNQPWAVFNPHHKLADGTWYWQYAVTNDGRTTWSPVYTFRVTDAARVFETHTAKELIAACPRSHPRLLARAEQLGALRQRVQGVEAAATLITMARNRLGQKPPDEKEAAPKRSSQDESQARKLASDASKKLGQRVWNVVSVLCQAYLLTGEEPFGRQAARWAVHVAQWDRAGISGRNDLGDTFCLEAMALAYDSCYSLLSDRERKLLLTGINARAGHFFAQWVNHLEAALHPEHNWAYILPRTLQAAVATVGDLPEAEQWLTYAYEVWLARAPTAGTSDGGFMVGTNYNGIEGESLIALPTLFQGLAGDNFFAQPFYRNNLYYLLYCQPPQSYGDGFGDAHEMEKGPRAFHLRYFDALARRIRDPYATWYLQKGRAVAGKRESKKKSLDWGELTLGQKPPVWRGPFTLPQARAFCEAGVVAMHTHLDEPTRDLFVGFRSSPWGSFGHAQADQNTFNVIAGGERLFYSSGYKMPMGDPHMLGWYKHTRGHNGILVDGKGQPLGSEAFGWVPRFLHGERLSYCVGDASRAYDANPTADETEMIPDAKGQAKLGVGHAGLKRFRRHVVLLRPATVVIYDDLVADHPAEWSWLLHSMEELHLEADRHRLFASAGKARGRVNLIGSVPLRFEVTSHFGVPAVNWRGKISKDGEELSYADNQWHFTGLSGRKTPVMRFLAVIQVRLGGDVGEFAEVTTGADGWLRVGDWQIRAELDVSRRANLEVRSVDGTAGLVTSQGRLTVAGKVHEAKRPGSSLLVEKVGREWIIRETVDDVPEVAR